MEKNIENFELSEITNKYHECKKWQSEIETWEDRIQFMKDKTIQFLGIIEDENKRVDARVFFYELDGRYRGKLEWLKHKLEIHEVELKSFFKEKNLRSTLVVKTPHDFYKKEVTLLREDYADMRTDFLKLFKTQIKSNRNQNHLKNAA